VTGQHIDSVKLERARQFRGQMTPAEQLLWDHLRANRLEGFHFRRQQIIDGFMVDFYRDAAALVVELDGSIHDKQLEYDSARDRPLTQRGLTVMRIANQRVVEALDEVLGEILEACRGGTQS
jgi:very-short-patch-repair endonuclease